MKFLSIERPGEMHSYTYFSSKTGPFAASTLPYFLFLIETS